LKFKLPSYPIRVNRKQDAKHKIDQAGCVEGGEKSVRRIRLGQPGKRIALTCMFHGSAHSRARRHESRQEKKLACG
jgi:hypothetical protein